MDQFIQNYIKKIQSEFGTGKATEHTYRPALKELLESINPHITALNEGQRTIKVGAPDFRIIKRDLEIGWIEAKDLHVSLDDKTNKEQLNRYLDASDNLIFTNNLEFRYFRNKQFVHGVSLGEIQNGKLIIYEETLLGNNIKALGNLIEEFLNYGGQFIKSSKQLAEIMSGKARLLNDIIYKVVSDQEDIDQTLQDQYKAFKNMLVHDLTFEQFSDMYAQTIVYGLFVARLHDDTLDTFSRGEAEKLIPKSNDFLRNLFRHIAFELDERISWIVDSLTEIFNHCNIKELLENHGKSTSRTDPIIHFYETFLTEYNPKLRKSRGVYYTPAPVVNFIIRGIDQILKNEFGISNGLADTSKIESEKIVQGKKIKQQLHKVQLLDPATGTGTFLNEVVKHIYEQFGKNNQGIRQSYVDEHLLPRIFGFELLMAPYTMAHLKLGLTLAETGYENTQSKIGIYLTNSLEEAHTNTQSLFSSRLSAESEKASEIKNNAPIMIVTGNPPYSVSSTNKGERIQNLITDYKKDLNERKINLDDDYIKFIRYAQYYIDKNGEGIVAMITNNSYIDGITHRQMRKSLMESFDKIYVYDLHGNAKKKEVCPDGSKDENVFDIMQGVSIIFAVKNTNSKKLAEIYYYDSWGKREIKYEKLWNNDFLTTEREQLKPVAPYYFFVPKDFGAKKKYDEGTKITDIFGNYSAGIKTKVDNIVIDFNKDILQDRIKSIEGISKNEIMGKFNLPNNTTWEYLNKLNLIFDPNKLVSYEYRPFDIRYIYYDKDFLSRARNKIMDNFYKKSNLGLEIGRTEYLMVYIGKHISDEHYGGHSSYRIPLYLYETDLSGKEIKIPNLDTKIIEKITKDLGLKFIQDGAGDKINTFGPEDVFDYIYATLHSPTYREKYKEFLKIDFPRIPFTKDKFIFSQLIKYGQELRKLHLLESDKLNQQLVSYPISGYNKVEKVRLLFSFDEGGVEGNETENFGKVWINDTQYFDNVPEIAWNFYIGGYQPAQKRLKDRKDRILSFEDIIHYQKMIISLSETDKIMKEINKVKFL